MNLFHLKYVVSIAECGSINKASEKLHVAQPNLSRVIREMEADLGIQFFRRSSKGMQLTPDGEVFISHARKILKQVEEVEQMYKSHNLPRQRFSISVPRASYIADAFARFTKSLHAGDVEIFYHETNSLQAIRNILEVGYNLGIIRYSASYDSYFKQLLDDKGLQYDLITDFRYVLVMREDSPLANLPVIHYEDLQGLIQISHADPYIPSMPLSAVKTGELPENPRQIFVFERGSQFDLLSTNPETFMWVSPLPERILNSLHLVQRVCDDNHLLYRDMMIHRKDYQLSELDRSFITELTLSKRSCIYSGFPAL